MEHIQVDNELKEVEIKTKQVITNPQIKISSLFENVMNFILNHKLDFEYDWKIRIWGDIFNIDDDKKFLKEVVANGNIALLPKLMSAEGISMRDTKAMTEYIKTLGFYKDFMTYTLLKNAELKEQAAENQEDEEVDGEGDSDGPGRKKIPEQDIDNEQTSKSRDNGTDSTENRDH